MRCSCADCGVYMNHAEDLKLGCVCPNCGFRCNACLGTDSILSKEDLKQIERPWFDFNEPETVKEDY